MEQVINDIFDLALKIIICAFPISIIFIICGKITNYVLSMISGKERVRI